ncbi:MAG: hypothetical protein ACRD4I_03460, partial [Candidatus Angelobacter sp.]
GCRHTVMADWNTLFTTESGIKPGLIPLTVAEIKRLFNLATRRLQPETHHLRWVWWRRRHQARAKWFHHRTRLRQQTATT